jgi:putative addiction module component (TIGR02574 family)
MELPGVVIIVIPADLKGLTEQALKLPPHDRIVLAESLLLTVDDSDDPAFDEATMANLERRLREMREGTVEKIPVEEALEEVRDALKRRA